MMTTMTVKTATTILMMAKMERTVMTGKIVTVTREMMATTEIRAD